MLSCVVLCGVLWQGKARGAPTRGNLATACLLPQVFRFMAWLAGAEARDLVEAANRATHRGELKEPSQPLSEEAYRAAAASRAAAS